MNQFKIKKPEQPGWYVIKQKYNGEVDILHGPFLKGEDAESKMKAEPAVQDGKLLVIGYDMLNRRQRRQRQKQSRKNVRSR